MGHEEGLVFVTNAVNTPTSVQLHVIQSKTWIIDSGESFHYTNVNSPMNRAIKTCSGSATTARSQTFRIKSKGENKKFFQVTLVPEIGLNRLSVGQFTVDPLVHLQLQG